MSINKKILVFTATYNEAENISLLLEKILKTCPSADILVIDDNSPDSTSDIIEKLMTFHKNIFLIKRKSKLGLDTAHKEGYEFSIKNDYDYLITMDADMSHDPDEIKNFISKLEKYSFVIGSRYMMGGKCLMKKSRLILSKYGNLTMRYLLRIDISEFTTSYRGFNLKKLNNFHLNNVKMKGYSFFMGTIFELSKKSHLIKEIPIIFKDRTKGYSKIPKLEIFRTLKNLLIMSLKKN
jgi:dolichol-phosphate mannosyltransferase